MFLFFKFLYRNNKIAEPSAPEVPTTWIFFFSKSFISMNIAMKSTSIIEGISENDNSIKSKMMGYNFFNKNFSHRIDKFLYEKDFKLDKKLKEKLKDSKKEIFYNDFHVIKNLDSRILFLRNKNTLNLCIHRTLLLVY